MSDEYKNDSGKYFDNDKGDFSQAHADAYDEATIGELLQVTDSLL